MITAKEYISRLKERNLHHIDANVNDLLKLVEEALMKNLDKGYHTAALFVNVSHVTSIYSKKIFDETIKRLEALGYKASIDGDTTSEDLYTYIKIDLTDY